VAIKLAPSTKSIPTGEASPNRTIRLRPEEGHRDDPECHGGDDGSSVQGSWQLFAVKD
jgi:hypothetical protein